MLRERETNEILIIVRGGTLVERKGEIGWRRRGPG